MWIGVLHDHTIQCVNSKDNIQDYKGGESYRDKTSIQTLPAQKKVIQIAIEEKKPDTLQNKKTGCPAYFALTVYNKHSSIVRKNTTHPCKITLSRGHNHATTCAKALSLGQKMKIPYN